ncbi:SirB1 family protein [Salsipaludibacter albus]|uniref:SirB1 family protein n=1 Tax=Salsipaludibacter albus TaxID=2849650 RepID=UPI001EE463E1|nr:transglutaminase-like domain-containing protein [Salsipaludibacter albus]MBY5162573.1 transglutaminase-like domain-containing protein [Salsipaludibacter albus]
MGSHTTDTRRRLARLVRRSDADLAEAALLVNVEAMPDLDVDVALLRIDALSDAFRVWWGDHEELEAAAALRGFLAHEQGFTGGRDDYHHPDNALLVEVMDRRQGLPILLAVLYAAIARRVGIPAWGIAQPGHFYLGIGDPERPTVLDPFDDGREVAGDELAERLRLATAGRVPFTRSQLRPTSPAMTVRRILNNLTRDYTARGMVNAALWTVELKLVLPNTVPDDHKARGELLTHVGRYGEAADEFETYLDLGGDDRGDADDIRARAVRARARLN